MYEIKIDDRIDRISKLTQQTTSLYMDKLIGKNRKTMLPEIQVEEEMQKTLKKTREIISKTNNEYRGEIETALEILEAKKRIPKQKRKPGRPPMKDEPTNGNQQGKHGKLYFFIKVK